MPAKQTSESIEAEAGLPIVERMAALGMSQAAIDHAQIWLDALSKVVSGRADHLKRELAEDADASSGRMAGDKTFGTGRFGSTCKQKTPQR